MSETWSDCICGWQCAVEPSLSRPHCVPGRRIPCESLRDRELHRQPLLIDNGLGDGRAARVFRETGPYATACALQVDRGDLPVGGGGIRVAVNLHNRAHAAAAKRSFRLPSYFG